MPPRLAAPLLLAAAALLVVPLVVEWLRHRPHRRSVPTGHILSAGMAVQFALLIAALAILIAA